MKAGGAGTAGGAYLGPTLHPLSREMQIAAAQAVLLAVLRFSVGQANFAAIDFRCLHLKCGARSWFGPMAKDVVLLSLHP